MIPGPPMMEVLRAEWRRAPQPRTGTTRSFLADAHGQPLAAALPSRSENFPTVASGHAGAETMGALTTKVVGLVRALHGELLNTKTDANI